MMPIDPYRPWLNGLSSPGEFPLAEAEGELAREAKRLHEEWQRCFEHVHGLSDSDVHAQRALARAEAELHDSLIRDRDASEEKRLDLMRRVELARHEAHPDIHRERAQNAAAECAAAGNAYGAFVREHRHDLVGELTPGAVAAAKKARRARDAARAAEREYDQQRARVVAVTDGIVDEALIPADYDKPPVPDADALDGRTSAVTQSVGRAAAPTDIMIHPDAHQPMREMQVGHVLVQF